MPAQDGGKRMNAGDPGRGPFRPVGAVIDAHQHAFWRGSDRPDGDFSPSRLVADLDEQGITRAWLLTWEIMPFEDHPEDHGALNPANLRPNGSHAGITLSDTLFARDRYPDRFVAGFSPHPGSGRAAERFAEAVRNCGVRVCGEWKCRMPFDDPECLRLFRKAGELGCPVLLHLDVPELPGPDGKPSPQKRWYGGTVGNLARAARACPGAVFIGHGPGFWREISGDADSSSDAYPQGPVTPGGRIYALLEECPNVMADLSASSALTALSRDPERGRTFLRTYSKRLLFGRDDYGSRTMDFLLSQGLPETALADILGNNARRLVPD